MAVPAVDYFSALGKVAGLTGQQVIDIATSQGNPAIWEILENAGGALSGWNLMYDEAGNVAALITQNGQFFNFMDDAVGAVSEYVGGNQLITDVAVAGNEMTVFTGDIVQAGTGEVTKRGLMAGATTGANILSGVCAAVGGIMTGVNWYRDNPEFWTSVSQKILPFAYKDPTDKSWGDIFYDALVPAAVDSTGKTYVQSDIVSAIMRAMYEGGFYSPPTTYAQVSPEISADSGYAATGIGNMHIPYIQTHVGGYASPVSNLYDTYLYRLHESPYDLKAAIVEFTEDTDTTKKKLILTVPQEYTGQRALEYGHRGYESIQYSVPDEFPWKYPGVSTTQFKIGNVIIEGRATGFPDEFTSFPVGVPVSSVPSTYSKAGKYVVHIMERGTYGSEGGLTNTSVQGGATIPQSATQSLEDLFPDWFKNALTTVDPNSTAENVIYNTWLPLTLTDTSTDTEGNTAQNQQQAQIGQPAVDWQLAFDKWLQQAYKTQTLPQPKPEKETGSEGTDPPDPKPVDPTPGIPTLTGAASALWKIYNPSLITLQQFGAWLWSTDPIKMIREIFNNQPADGIIGLHAIYTTPPTMAAQNIKVGYVDSGIPAPVVATQYTRFSCGTVQVPLYYQSALDFSATHVLIYLPFIGIQELDPYDVMGKTLEVIYSVDILTGIVLAQIVVSATNYRATLYQFNGSCGVEYPLTSGSRSSQMLSLITGAVAGGAVGGIGAAVVGGIRGAATGANVRMSGNLAGNAGAMGIRKPFLIIKRPVESVATDYNQIYGYPANKTDKLSNFTGYTRVKSAHIENIPRATAAEKDKIMAALQAGVIV